MEARVRIDATNRGFADLFSNRYIVFNLKDLCID